MIFPHFVAGIYRLIDRTWISKTLAARNRRDETRLALENLLRWRRVVWSSGLSCSDVVSVLQCSSDAEFITTRWTDHVRFMLLRCLAKKIGWGFL